MSAEDRLAGVLATIPHRIVACSGGVDSLLLADVAHSLDPGGTRIVHAVTPAVPDEATSRVREIAVQLRWRLELVESAEFSDERYLENPVDRCYFCKSNLYDALDAVDSTGRADGAVVLTGANLDDLGEYRPGLSAAAERGVRHPFVEAEVTKSDLRAIANSRGREWHDLAAAPCLASRLYTGTRVTPELTRAVDAGERVLREQTGITVARCRVRSSSVLVEVGRDDRHLVDTAVLASISKAMRRHAPQLHDAVLDAADYAPGRSFVRIGR